MTPLLPCVVIAALGPLVSPTTADLDGDKEPDSVRVEWRGVQASRCYVVHVNDAVLSGPWDIYNRTFSIVDIDSTDSLLEIAIPACGSSDDHRTYFHSYDGEAIRFMGIVDGTYSLEIDGSGLIRTACRGRLLATWFYPCIYDITAGGLLRKVAQELYPMGAACVAKLAIPLCASRSDATVVTVVHPGDAVVIVASDDARWCLARSQGGLWGWFEVGLDGSVLSLGAQGAEVFEGLSYAD